MPTSSEQYHGCEIQWDVSLIAGTQRWKATGAVVCSPSEPGGAPIVKTVPDLPESFLSKIEALEAVLKKAREMIDGQAPNSLPSEITTNNGPFP